MTDKDTTFIYPFFDGWLGDAVYEALRGSFAFAYTMRPKACHVVLSAGWKRKIDLSLFPGKTALNIHPSLLPAYRGARPLARACADQAPHIGVTIHEISDEFDCGPIRVQRGFKMEPGWTLDDAGAKIKPILYHLIQAADMGGPGVPQVG